MSCSNHDCRMSVGDTAKKSSSSDESNTSLPGLVEIASSGSAISDSCDALMTPKKREEMAKQICQDLGLNFQQLDKESKIRAKRIVTGDFTWSQTKEKNSGGQGQVATSFQDEFNEFCGSHPVWKEGDFENVFFTEKDTDNEVGYLVIRRQRTDTCYMHAVVTFVHYLQALRNGARDHKMVDVCDYMREHMIRHQKDDLKNHIIGKGGGDSLRFLKSITGIPHNKLKHHTICLLSVEEDAKAIYDHFKKHKEPGLVYKFQIEERFKNRTEDPSPSSTLFQGIVDETKLMKLKVHNQESRVMTHSVLLIGARFDAALGMYFFLLQNWHIGFYFLEVSAEYLCSTEASVVFLHPDYDGNIAPLEKFKLVDALYAEADTPTERFGDQFYNW